ncbi:MAG: NAD(P)-dependent oxidoreductase [Pseudomonadota bacterium]
MKAGTSHQSGVASADIDLVLARTPAPVWEALRGQRLFITGGTGFVGCWLLEALLAANARLDLDLALTVLTRDPARFSAKAPHLAGACALVAGDMADLSHIDGAYDTIIHAATDVVAPNADPRSVYRDIVAGTEQTLALAARCKATRYLLVSSGAVYGRQPAELDLLPESYPGAPDTSNVGSAYGQAKRASEWLCYAAAGALGFAPQVARCFAFVGPYMALDAQFAVGNFIRDSLAGSTVRIGGDGTPYRSYLYAADLAIWLLTILVQGDGHPYNVGSSSAISVGELAHAVSAQLCGAPKVAIAKSPEPGQPAERYVPATARAATLGLHAFTPLADAIARTAAWHQHQQETA